MTVEEIDIIVTASVEEALKEFKKMVPQIKKELKQVQQNISNIDMKGLTSKTQQAVDVVKEKINQVKNTNIGKSLQTQFQRAGTSVEKYQQQLEQTQEQLSQVINQLDAKHENAWKAYTPEGVEVGDSAIEAAVNKALGADKEYQRLISQETKLNQKVHELNQKLLQAKQNYANIGVEVQQVQSKQSVFTGMSSKLKNAFKSIKEQSGGVVEAFSKIPNITTVINSKIRQINKGMRKRRAIKPKVSRRKEIIKIRDEMK